MVSPALGDFTVRARAEADPAAVGPVDLVLFAVKAYDNDTAIPQLAPLVGTATAVLTLQNGIDSTAQLAAALGEARVLGGTTYVATAIEAPGRIVQTGVHRSIIFGEAFGERREISPRVRAIAAVLSAADIEVDRGARRPGADLGQVRLPGAVLGLDRRRPAADRPAVAPGRTSARRSTPRPGKWRRSPPPRA